MLKRNTDMGKYRVIIVDPPWNTGKTGLRNARANQGVQLDYPVMLKHEIMALPVPQWAADNAFLWLWATNSKDRDTREPILRMAFDIMSHWDFTYYTMITWVKPTGVCPFGPYQITTEHVLFGYRGKTVFPKECLGKMRTAFNAPVTRHSEKPQVFYDTISRYFPGPRIDLFARQVREGFDGWGNEYPQTGNCD